MSALDPTVAKHLDARPSADADSDEDELLASLESDEAALDAFREQRMQQLHNEVLRARLMKERGNGEYKPVGSEKEVLDITTQTPNAVVHFSHADFRRCRIMDAHLSALAPRHVEARFVRCDVESAPFLVERLLVRVLPCVIAFVDGKSVGRIEGFELLGNTDVFKTSVLENVLVGWGVLERVRGDGGAEEGQREREERERDLKGGDSDDDDWD